jgi:hypothetical protein
MRISGYGAGFGQQSAAKDRAAAFRARHSIGQRIKGRILRREQNGLYWVQAGDEELLARLEVHADPGDELIFIVRALTPEIMLQALSGGMSAADLPGLVQRFRAAREVFEVHSAKLLAALRSTSPQPALRLDAFNAALSANPEASQHFAKVQDLLAQINTSLGAQQNAVAQYQPWLLPGQRRQEMLTRPKAGGFETAISAVDATAGAFESRLATATDAARLTLSADKPEACGALQVELCALAREESGLEPEMLGPTRLRPNSLGGVLGELFGSVPSWSSGGLNTRV